MSNSKGACNGGPAGGSAGGPGKQRWIPVPEPGEIATHWWHLA